MDYKLACFSMYSHRMGYDRCFRQRAAATGRSDYWTDIDVTIWSLFFANKGTKSRCTFCFCKSHEANSSPLANHSQPPPGAMQGSQLNSSRSMTGRKRVSLEWNKYRMPYCSWKDCAYKHVCYLC